MSRIGISYQNVAEAAITLQGRNENPTVDRVREILGTGSKSTIARHLKAWKDSHGDVASANGLPPELVAIVAGIWERIQAQAEQQIQINKQATELAIAELKSQMLLLESEFMQTRDANKILKHTLIEAQLSSSKLHGQIDSLEEHLNEQKQENTKLHALLKSLKLQAW